MAAQRYLVTARKYRPNLFGELVAQEHVTETLKNAIRLDRLAHAYLFSGPRGVGKTTAARILAKAINCTTPPEDRTDAAEPCRQCDSCRDFEEGRSLNIFEIDAASNNKVEDIRDLRETVRIPPQGSRKKVYIIDEVHMLSNAAFNALLKTLEEPPPHVLFIFATTEPHKVLPTILSRCQRFDFRRIPVPNIVAHLQEICRQENLSADEASLMLLARKGDGALRDALSAFDQAISLCGTDLQYTGLAEALRVVDIDLFFDVSDHVTARSSTGMLRLVDQIVRSGYDLQEFLVGLAEHLRNLLVALTMVDTALIEAAEATRQRYAEASRVFSEATLLRLLMIVDEAEESIKSSTHPRMKLEMALLKMAGVGHTADLRHALQQLERLEAMAREGKLAPGLFGIPEAAPSPTPAPAQTLPASTPTAIIEEPPPSIPETETAAPPKAEAPAEPTPPPDAEQKPTEPPLALETEKAEIMPPVEQDPTDTAPSWDEEAPTAPPLPPPPQEDPPPQPPSAAPGYLDLFGAPALRKLENTAPAETAGPQNMVAAPSATATVTAVATASALPVPLMATWDRFVQAVKKERIHVGALLQHATPLEINTDTLIVGVPDEFHRRLLSNQDTFLLKHLKAQQMDEIDRLLFIVRDDLDTNTPEDLVPDIDPQEYMQQKRQESPVIQAIFEQFGGELVW